MTLQQQNPSSHRETILLERVKDYVYDKMNHNDPAHDGDHIRRVAELTYSLCRETPEANLLRAMLIAYLHDMQDDKLCSNTSTQVLRDELRNMGVEEEDITFVLEGIGYISYRKYPKLSPDVPIEIRIVQDADRIDAMGAMGIARTFAYGGAKGRPLDESIAHFEEKLLKLYDLLGTEEGKKLAAPRHELLLRFYDAYKKEGQGTV